MGDTEISGDFRTKLGQLKTNLGAWTIPEWIFFFVVIPGILVVISLLSQGIRDSYFILNTGEIGKLQTWFLSSYTHSEFYPHLVSNLVVYFFTILAIFSFENDRHRFRVMAAISFLLVPIISSLLTIGLFHLLGFHVQSQGFSAIVAALLAYMFISIILWMLGDTLGDFDHPEYSRSLVLFYLMCGLLTFILALIVVEGLNLGLFMNTGNSTDNGIAHFGGFMTNLIAFLFYDIKTRQRKYFHMTLGIAIAMGIVWYGNYLFALITSGNGL